MRVCLTIPDPNRQNKLGYMKVYHRLSQTKAYLVDGSSAHIESGSSAHIANESSAHRETGSSAHIERSSAHIDAGYQPFRLWLGGVGGDKSVIDAGNKGGIHGLKSSLDSAI